MKHAPFRSALMASVAAGLAAQGSACAQTFEAGDSSGWFVRASAVARFNVKASIESVSKTPGPGVYEDGYVLPDSGGPGSGQTWNWGFDSAAQAAGNQLVLQRLDNVPSIGQQDIDVSNPIFGGEIIGGLRSSQFALWKKPARVSLEFGLGYSALSEDGSLTASGTASRTTDSFGLGGLVPPIAPYRGTAKGPGPLLGLNPSGNVVVTDFPGGTTTGFQGSLDASFYTFRIGPALAIDLSKRLSLGFGVGYSSVYADSRLKYDEVITFSNPALPAVSPTHESITEGSWRLGFYAEVRLNYRLSRYTELFAGFDFQHNSDFTFGDPKYEATLELGSTYAAKTGITFTF